MSHLTFDLHFAARREDTNEVLQFRGSVDIPVIDATHYATADLATGTRHPGGKGIDYHAHDGKFYSWPLQNRLDQRRLAAILRWETQPDEGVNGHPLSLLGQGEAFLHDLKDGLFPPDWLLQRSYGNPPIIPFAAASRLYGATNAAMLRYLGDVPPERLKHPPMAGEGEPWPAKATETMEAVRGAFAKHFAFVDGKLTKIMPEPLLMVRTMGGATSAVFIDAFGDDWTHGEQTVRGLYALSDLPYARNAAHRLATRFGGTVKDKTNVAVHAPDAAKISYWKETWDQVRSALPKTAIKHAMSFPDEAILAIAEMSEVAFKYDRRYPKGTHAINDPLSVEWLSTWRRFQESIGDWRNAWHLGNNGLKRIHLMNEFTRAILAPMTAVPAHALPVVEQNTPEIENILGLTQEFLARGGPRFAKAWVELRRTRDEAVARNSARTMLVEVVAFHNDAARRRWQERVQKVVREFAGVPEPEPSEDDQANRLLRDLNRNVLDKTPSPDGNIAALQAHFDRQFDRVMYDALEKGWPLDQVNAALRESVRSRTTQEGIEQ